MFNQPSQIPEHLSSASDHELKSLRDKYMDERAMLAKKDRGIGQGVMQLQESIDFCVKSCLFIHDELKGTDHSDTLLSQVRALNTFRSISLEKMGEIREARSEALFAALMNKRWCEDEMRSRGLEYTETELSDDLLSLTI
ncbi:hypothetical protein CJU89_4952 [Yarrowia sp. B02]|nr:hypothetical protein CJU89_4952 [Yarrowia sp. B02]